MISPEDWTPVDGITLEPNAISAVKASTGSVVVAAGPGAGKTELLAQRADFLFRTGACLYPQRILAVSFKVDAARNLRERVRRRSGARYAARFDSFTFHAFAKRIIDNYRLALTGPDALNPDYRVDRKTRIEREQITFDDMVPLALDILEKNLYARGGIRQTYSHVFFDEFQDATDTQYKLIKVAFGESAALLTAVGDVKQRIMAFAGALDGILQTFADDFDAVSLPLYQNFRSAPRLRRMQNRMIADMDPDAASDIGSLAGDDGVINICEFGSDVEEAEYIADLVKTQIDAGTPRAEIAILIRQQPHLMGAPLFDALTTRGIPFRNEQTEQDLAAEPAAALILNFIRVVADDRQPTAYAELMRVASRPDASEEDALRFDRQLKRLLQEARRALRAAPELAGELAFWRAWTDKLIRLVTRPALLALSPGYAQGSRFDDLVDQALLAFEAALRLAPDPSVAVQHLSDTDAIRILTIHKCKGLEFEHVIILGVENETFWGKPDRAMAEFFVGVSRAKTQLTLTCVEHRRRPHGHTGRWDANRTAHETFLNYALDE
ncbi:ATP-dependent helicase [uncultured Citricoccus sp.]|uniref:ATP-dependent helicase n=1 Tax=uncultured Citricoccus sp. TaxID=614031 RepID=UPI00261D4C9F|nr:ATP-dependent helicase [uncultured Citricoccus sp.]